MGDKNVPPIYPAVALSLCHQEGGTDSGSLGEENLIDFLWLGGVGGGGSSRITGEPCPPGHQGDPVGLAWIFVSQVNSLEPWFFKKTPVVCNSFVAI